MILTFILPLVATSQRLGSSDEGWGSGGSSPWGFLYTIGFFILAVYECSTGLRVSTIPLSCRTVDPFVETVKNLRFFLVSSL